MATKKQSGYTLIEIMIALFLGLIVVGTTVNIYITTVGSSSGIIKSARLNHDLESVMTLMINDIRRSGYWGGATVEADTRNNPFTTGNANIQIPSNNCILYTYDANGSGINTPTVLTDDVDANEYYGFKFQNGTITLRKTGTTTADCTDGTWEEFVDGNQLTITALQFSFAPMVTPYLPAKSRCLNVSTDPPTSTDTDPTACTTGAASGNNLAEKRLVNIYLAGQLTSDATVTKTLTGTIEVRNNRLYQKP